MSTEHDGSEPGGGDPGAGVGPQTPAARRRVGLPVPQEPGLELAALEQSAAEDVEVHAGPPSPPAVEPAPAPAGEPGTPPEPAPHPEPAGPPEAADPSEAAGPAQWTGPPEAAWHSDAAGPAEPADQPESTEPPDAAEPLDTADPLAPADPLETADPLEPADPAEGAPPGPDPDPVSTSGFGQPPTRRSALAPRSAPASTRERAAALLALGSATGVLIFLLLSLGSSPSPVAGVGDFDVRASLRAVAPGGWIALTGSDAPERTSLLLEARANDGRWRTAGRSTSDDEGAFRVEGRVLARPGLLSLRVRAPRVATSAPVTVTVRPLRLASVGDINLGDAPGAAIAANGPRYPWTSVGTALRGADIAFGNLECAVSTRGEPFPKQFNFRGSPEALRGLRRRSGIDVLNLANNHTGDFGREAIVDTVQTVERLGMRAVGAGPDLRRALAPQVVERLGLRVAFVGFSNIAPLEFAAGDNSPGTAWASAESITAAVRAARRRADVVVATFHWGIEKAPFETADQRLLAQTAAAAGAQLVIGAHPHVLQPLRREGAALVAYSLGNFVFGAGSSDTAATGILVTDLTAEGVGAARWRAGRIVSARPMLDPGRPRRLPVRDDRAMTDGVSL
jgi:Bacterial capsule synthesis protein PGA_cap